MKILLISNGRTGSYSICEWLSKELNIKFITEIDNSLDYKVEDNFILKRTLFNNDFDLEDIKHFDKIIILYRKNILKQSESNIYAILRKKWHHYSNSIIDGYYEIDKDFLINNHETIWNSKYQLDNEKNKMLNLKFGFKISYEEIFEDKVGQKLISDYIDFNPKTNLDFELKMRNNDDKSQIDSYEREIKRLLLKIQYLKNDNEELKTTLEKYEELKTLVDLMRKTSNKLL
jgi:hypothetical protein